MKINFTAMTAIMFFSFCLSAVAFGQQARLEGNVYEIANGNEVPVAGVRVLAPGGQSQDTDSKGHFVIDFPNSVQAGQATRIEVNRPGWVIIYPLYGEFATQDPTRNFTPLKVIIVPKGSPLALEPKRLSEVIARWADERERLRGELADLQQPVSSQVIEHPYLSGTVASYLLLPVIWLLLLWLRPLWLLRISAFLSRYEPKIKTQNTEINLPVRYIVLISLFHYRSRVLDAWVNRYIVDARENFASKQTVAQRRVYITMPALLNENICENVLVGAFQPIFDKRKITLLIAGEGGAGKTSLACQMAMWAMADEPEQRLCKTHRMLPVLIESNLEARSEVKDLLVNAVSGGLKELISEPEPVFEELLLQLLRKRRVLVIIDSLSELDDATRRSMRPTDPNFPIAALLVTSRIDEDFGGASKALLRPLRLKSDRLSTFMDRYLEQLSKRELFNDEEYFDACRLLSQLVSDREITVLIAKMYAEQMIAAKEADASAQAAERELPRNLPDLMLGYVKRLNDQVKSDRQDIRKVVNIAKIAAWECLKHTCRPTTAKRDDVQKALGNEPDAETLLNYFMDRLQLIQTTGPISDLIRFSLDPLAEYLAALYLVERCGKFEDLWKEFFENAEEQSGAP